MTDDPEGGGVVGGRAASAELRFRGAAGVVLASQVIGAALAYGMHVLFARSLSTDDYGVVAYILGLTGVLGMLVAGGVPGVGLRFVRQDLADGRLERVLKYWRWAVRRFRNASMSVVGIAALAAGVASWFTSVRVAELVLLGASLVLVFAWTELHQATGRTVARHAAAFVPQLIVRPGLILLALAVVWVADVDLDAVGALLLYLTVAGTAAAAQFGLIHRAFLFVSRRAIPSRNPVDAVPDSWMATSSGLWVFTVLSLLLLRSNLLLLGIIQGPEPVAWYNAASKTAGLAAFVFFAVTAVISPHFGEAASRADGRVGLQALLRRSMHAITWPTLVLVLVMIVLAPTVLALFGPSYPQAAPILILLLLAGTANALFGPLAALLNTTGLHGDAVRVHTWAVAFNLVIAVPLILAAGAWGAAAADTTTILLVNVWMWRIARAKLGVDPSLFQFFRSG